MTLKKSTAVTILNGIVNPLFMCSFLPIVEGKPGLDFQGLTGFWGQLILAIGIAQFVGFLPLFGKAIETCVEFFGFDRNTPGARICGTVVGATLLFCIIGLFEVAFQSGVGVIDGVPFSRAGFASWWADGPLSLWAACCLILLSRPLPLKLRANSAKTGRVAKA